jgi:hypothetical protein
LECGRTTTGSPLHHALANRVGGDVLPIRAHVLEEVALPFDEGVCLVLMPFVQHRVALVQCREKRAVCQSTTNQPQYGGDDWAHVRPLVIAGQLELERRQLGAVRVRLVVTLKEAKELRKAVLIIMPFLLRKKNVLHVHATVAELVRTRTSR